MRFYKGDIVEVINYLPDKNEIGNRYRLTMVRVSWDGETVIYHIDPIGDFNYARRGFTYDNIMLYSRPFTNHLKDICSRLSALFYKTKNNK